LHGVPENIKAFVQISALPWAKGVVDFIPMHSDATQVKLVLKDEATKSSLLQLGLYKYIFLQLPRVFDYSPRIHFRFSKINHYEFVKKMKGRGKRPKRHFNGSRQCTNVFVAFSRIEPSCLCIDSHTSI
jgi:hypothetical protein